MSADILERPENSIASTVPDAYYLGDIRISPPVAPAPMADVTNRILYELKRA
ncbi:hypothetical protein LC607_35385 [Nostoc sp. CHAB 5824]|nr:hypothetical protein [Nostoc sp. CHAB 5824]